MSDGAIKKIRVASFFWNTVYIKKTLMTLWTALNDLNWQVWVSVEMPSVELEVFQTSNWLYVYNASHRSWMLKTSCVSHGWNRISTAAWYSFEPEPTFVNLKVLNVWWTDFDNLYVICMTPFWHSLDVISLQSFDWFDNLIWWSILVLSTRLGRKTWNFSKSKTVDGCHFENHYYLPDKTAKIIKTKPSSVSLCCKSHCFKTAEIKVLGK